jgi:hypothetical protein
MIASRKTAGTFGVGQLICPRRESITNGREVRGQLRYNSSRNDD